ncbi:MAG TPA: hypothetical protein VN886_21205 [Acidimicrobiales bacterium]|nr:hypothetical protein [Acidimicrobiales bacterium]
MKRVMVIAALALLLTACGSSAATVPKAVKLSRDSIAYRFQHAPGTPLRHCVNTVALQQDRALSRLSYGVVLEARSGEVLAGNFLAYMIFPGKLIGKFYFNSLDPRVPKTHRLSITLSRPGSRTTGAVQHSQAGDSTQLTKHPTSGFFWPADVTFPATGQWQMVVQSSHTWGCFIVSA